MNPSPADIDRNTAARRGAVRTAWIVAGIAVAIYIAFVLSGILNA